MYILIATILAIYLLGRYAIKEGQRVERHKKFMSDMNNFNKRKKNG